MGQGPDALASSASDPVRSGRGRGWTWRNILGFAEHACGVPSSRRLSCLRWRLLPCRMLVPRSAVTDTVPIRPLRGPRAGQS